VKTEGERITRTLEYIRMFESEQYFAVRRSIEQFWDKHTETIRGATAKGEAELSKTVLDLIGADTQLKYNTLDILRFYEYFSACVCARTCDAATANAFLGKSAYDFMGLNYPFIAAQRKILDDQSFGRGVINLGNAYVNQGALTCN
jgi:hypothetical protein